MARVERRDDDYSVNVPAGFLSVWWHDNGVGKGGDDGMYALSQSPFVLIFVQLFSSYDYQSTLLYMFHYLFLTLRLSDTYSVYSCDWIDSILYMELLYWSWCLFLHFFYSRFNSFSFSWIIGNILCLRHMASLLCSVGFVVLSQMPKMEVNINSFKLYLCVADHSLCVLSRVPLLFHFTLSGRGQSSPGSISP